MISDPLRLGIVPNTPVGHDLETKLDLTGILSLAQPHDDVVLRIRQLAWIALRKLQSTNPVPR